MNRVQTFALLLLTSGAALMSGCAQGTIDDGDDQQVAPLLELESPDTDGEVLTATMFEGRDFVPTQPPLNAVLSESDTCNTIVGNYHAHGLELGCATTTHVCPDMLRFSFGQACLQYHTNTVESCRQRIVSSTSCEELWATSCDVVPVADSAPLGCTADAQ